MNMVEFAKRFYRNNYSFINNVLYGKYIFLSCSDLVSLLRYAIYKHDFTKYDVIVGIPRSGLYCANLLSMLTGKYLSDSENILKNKIWFRSQLAQIDFENVLLVEDSIYNGTSVKDFIYKCDNISNVDVFSVIVDKKSQKYTNYYCIKTNRKRCFEWSFLHNRGKVTGFDLDGVLCVDPSYLQTKYEPLYKEFLETAKPYMKPNFKIKYIVTSRKERYRSLTEEWLRKNKYDYDQLVMFRNSNDRKYKLLKGLPLDYFVESNYNQSKEIFSKTGIPVLCTDQMIMFS